MKLDKDIYSLPKDKVVQVTAKSSLEKIIKSRSIKAASAFGYFNYKAPLKRATGVVTNAKSHVRRDWLRAVCFTETPLDHIYLQTKNIYGRKLHFESYGLSFKEDLIRAKNGNPIFYVETNNVSIRNAFDALVIDPLAVTFKSMMPLIEGFGRPWFSTYNGPTEVDFRWEREWRICGDFSFSISDVAFGICPQDEIPCFENLLNNQIPFVDPIANLTAAKAKLKTCPHLKDLKLEFPKF